MSDDRRSPAAERPSPVRLQLFAAGTSPRHRRRRSAFAVVYLLAAVALLWPVYARFSAPFPLILGLPPSLAWIVLVLTVVFVALLALYLAERRDGEID